jgi:hypothetical protein
LLSGVGNSQVRTLAARQLAQITGLCAYQRSASM